VWVVGFGLVDSLALVSFNLHISFHLVYLVFCSWINSQTFGTRLKWGWLNKTPIFDHFPVDSTSHLHKLYCKRLVRLRVLIKTHIMRLQLDHYKLDVPKHSDLQNMYTLSKWCRGLVISGKLKIYNLIDKLIHLVLTLPISTATTEWAFSAMKLVKTILRSRMEDEFLVYHLVVYIEIEIAR